MTSNFITDNIKTCNDGGLMMALGLNLFICGVHVFSLFYKVFINIHKYANNTINIYIFFFYLLLRRSISDHYLRSCGYITCSRPQRTATGGLEPGTSRSKVLGFTTAPVRSTYLTMCLMICPSFNLVPSLVLYDK